MSFNGSGTFVVNTAGQPVVPNTVISSTAFNALTADLANGLSTCITKDGQTTPTANIPMGNNKITGLAAGTAGTDAANLSQVQGSTAKLLQSVTGTDTITAAMIPALTAYAAGQMFYFVAAGDNTGAVTINIDSLGAKSVTRDGSTALVAGDITNGKVVVIVYDGTRFQLLNSNAFTNLYVSGNLGVGTNTPAYKFHIVQNANDYAARITQSNASGSSGGLYIQQTNGGSNGLLVDTTGAYGNCAVFNGGNVGIGTSSPGSYGKLALVSSGSPTTAYHSVLSGVGSYNNAFESTVYLGLARTDVVDNNAIAGYRIKNYGANATGSYLAIEAASSAVGANAPPTTFTERMRLDSSGNLGIGTTTINYRAVADCNNAGNNDNGFAVRNANSSAYGGSYNFEHAVTGGNSPVRASYISSEGGSGNSFMRFATTVSGTLAERMRLDSSGNLLVGATANPGVLNTSVVVDSGANSLAGVVLQNNTTGRTSTDGSHIAISGSDFKIVNLENAPIIFTTNGVDRAQITGAGNFVAGPSVALATTATDGFLYVPTCAGTPTGTPTAITGMAPIVVNTTNNKLYFYSGGSWRDAGP